jgi:PKD repeat protein
MRSPFRTGCAVLFGVLVSCTVGDSPAVAPPGPAGAEGLAPVERHEVLATLARFEAWAEEQQAPRGPLASLARPLTRPLARTEGLALARARRAAMERLMAADPQRAVEVALPWEVREGLPEEVAALVEQPLDGVGDYEVVAAQVRATASAPEHETVEHALVFGGRRYRASGGYFGGRTVRRARVHGIALGDAVALSDSPVRVLGAEEPAGDAPSVPALRACESGAEVRAHTGDAVRTFCGAAELQDFTSLLLADAASAWTTGAKKVLYVRVDFSDLVGENTSAAGAQALMDGQVAPFLSANAFGATSITTTVIPQVLRMPKTAATYAASSSYFADLLADGRAVALAAGYDTAGYDLDVIAYPFISSFSFAGIAYVGAKGAQMNGDLDLRTHSHELGHNFGLLHANYWSTSDQSVIGSTGTRSEYSNPFDVMGRGNYAQHHFTSFYKNRLGWLPDARVATVTSSGTHALLPLETTVGAGTQALKLPRADGKAYWLEFRPQGTDHAGLKTGAVLSWGRPTAAYATESWLLDTTPGTSAGQTDAALTVGRTFSDANAGLHVTPTRVVAGSPDALEVVVHVGAFADNRPPTAVATASAAAVAAGGAVTFTATASDPDGDALAYWWDFGDGTVSDNSATVTRTFTSSRDATVVLTVSDMKGGLARSAVTVRAGTPSTYRLSGRVTANGAPLAGVWVGTSTSVYTRTDDTGSYVLGNVPSGSRTLTAVRFGYTLTAGFTNPLSVTADRTGLDFTAAATGPFTLSGRVVDGTTGLAGVSVSAGGQSAVTDASGYYALSGLANGFYPVALAKEGYAFASADAVEVIGSNVTAPDRSTSGVTVSGTVYGVDGAPTVTDGSRTATITTSTSGSTVLYRYSLARVPPGAYTLTATLPAFDIEPFNFTNPVTVATSNRTSLHFLAEEVPVTVSGTVTHQGAPVEGVRVADASGSTLTDASGRYTLSRMRGAYTLTPSLAHATLTPASRSITLTGAGSTGNDFEVSAWDRAPTVAAAATASPAAVAGTTTDLSVLGADDGDASALTYTWSATGPAAVTYSANGTPAARFTTATFSEAGSYTLTATVTDPGGQSATSSVAVTVAQTLASLSLSPTTATVATSATQAFTATARDQFGAAFTPASTWAVTGGGSVSTSGLFTAAATAGGPYTLSVTSGALSATAQVTVEVRSAPPTLATAAAAAPAAVSGTTTALSVLGADDLGEAALTYTWSASGSPAPTFSVNGTNAAKSTTATFGGPGSYTFTVTVRDAQSQTVTSTTAVTVQAVAAGVAVTPQGPTVLLGATRQLAASVLDQFGAALSPQPAVTWGRTGAGTVSAAGLYTAPEAPGTATVTATASGVSGTTTVTASAGAAPTVATAASATPGVVTGTATTLAVLGADDSGEGRLTYAWTASGPAAVTFSASGTNGAKAATATFSRAGSYTLTATVSDGGGQTATSSTPVEVAATATSVAVTPASASVTAGGSRAFAARVDDQFGTALSPQPSVTWAVAGGGTIDAAGLFQAGASAGGPHAVTATAGGASGSAQVTVTDLPPTIATGAAASPSPVTGTTAALSVRGSDDRGEAGLTYTWAASGPAPVAVSPNGSHGARDAVATFSAAGSYTLTVTATDASGQTATSSTPVEVRASLTSLTVAPSAATVLLGASRTFTATGRDQFGAALATPVTWGVDGGGSVSTAGVFTAAHTPGGPHTLTATATTSGGSLAATAAVTASAGAPPTVSAAAAAAPSPVTGTTAALSVLGADDSGEAHLTYAWDATGPAAVSFSASGTNGAKAATATFSRAGSYTLTATLRDGGGQTATSTLALEVSPTLTALALSPASADVLAGGAQAFTVAASDQFGAALSPAPSVTWSVSGGGAVSSSGLFSAGAEVGGPHTLSASAGGLTRTASLRVTAGAAPTVATAAAATPSPVTGTSTRVTVLGADDNGEALLTYAWSATGPAAVTFGASGTHGARDTTASFTRSGSYVLTATVRDPGGQQATSTVAVTVSATLTAFSLSPASGSVTVGQALQLAASGADQFGQPFTPLPALTWSTTGGGTVSASGLYSAGGEAGGPHEVRASGGGLTATAAVRVLGLTAPRIVSGPSGPAAPVTGTSAALSVTAEDDGGEAALTYAWAAVSGPAPVTFSPNGTGAARAATASFTAPGTYLLSVTVRDAGGETASATVSVVVVATPSALVVAPAHAMASPADAASSPADAVVEAGASLQLAAELRDQFGTPLLPLPAATWSAEGGGTVDAQGHYTAPATPGGAHAVVCRAGGLTGRAGVTVRDTRAPTVALTAPAAGATLQGQGQLTATAQDGHAVARVTFRVDDVWVGEDVEAPYTAEFDSRAFANGLHVVRATATDASGNTATVSLQVTVSNPDAVDRTGPTVALRAPADGAVLSGSVELGADAEDASGVQSVAFEVDGAPAGSARAAPYRVTLDTTRLASGAHTLVAVATDTAGNTTRSAPRQVTVGNAYVVLAGAGCSTAAGGPLGAGLPWALLSLLWAAGRARRRAAGR